MTKKINTKKILSVENWQSWRNLNRSTECSIGANYNISAILILNKWKTTNLAIDTYFITYSNYLEFEGILLAFRKKELFDINAIPTHIKRSEQGWWIGRKLLTPSKANQLYKNEPKKVDVSCLQWYRQIELDECFDLDRNG